jgi:hypothetical protein
MASVKGQKKLPISGGQEAAPLKNTGLQQVNKGQFAPLDGYNRHQFNMYYFVTLAKNSFFLHTSIVLELGKLLFVAI